MIPDDPTVLSYLLAGIIQVELPRRQALLEAETTEERLRGLLALIDRETFLLQRRLRFFRPRPRRGGPREAPRAEGLPRLTTSPLRLHDRLFNVTLIIDGREPRRRSPSSSTR